MSNTTHTPHSTTSMSTSVMTGYTPEELERLEAIFGDTMVITEDTGYTSRPEITEPRLFTTALANKVKHLEEDFISTSGQRDFLEHQISEANKYSSLVNDFKQGKTTCVLNYIAPKLTRSHTVEIHGIKFPLPDIKSKDIPELQTALDVYASVLTDSINSLLDVTSKKIDQTQSLRNIKEALPSSLIKSLGTRLNVFTSILYVYCLEAKLFKESSEFSVYIKTSPIIDDPYTHGAFIHSARSETIPLNGCLIPNNAIGVSLALRYNFNLNQLQLLIQSMFAHDLDQRAASRIQLLSTVKNEVRAEVVNHPTPTLHRIIRECFLTRRELLGIIFNLEHEIPNPHLPNNYAKNRCPSCSAVVHSTTTYVHHPSPCTLIDWLVSEFQLRYSSPLLTIPPLQHIRVDTTQYAKQMTAQVSQLRHNTFVSRTQDELVAYKAADDCIPRRLVHQGVKTVKVFSETKYKH